MQQTRNFAQEVVTRRAVHPPIGRESFTARENFLDHDVCLPGFDFGRPLLPEVFQTRAEAVAIPCRIGEPIDMINPKPVDEPARVQFEWQGVYRLEDVILFNSQARQFSDVEKATPVDAVASALPPGKHVVLSS